MAASEFSAITASSSSGDWVRNDHRRVAPTEVSLSCGAGLLAVAILATAAWGLTMAAIAIHGPSGGTREEGTGGPVEGGSPRRPDRQVLPAPSQPSDLRNRLQDVRWVSGRVAAGVASGVFAIAAIAGCTGTTMTSAPISDEHAGSPTTPCKVGDLRATATFSAAGANNNVYVITIADHDAPCVLLGRPDSLTGVGPAGTSVPIHPGRLSPDYVEAMTTGRPAELTATTPAEVVLVTTAACGEAQKHPRRDHYAGLNLGSAGGSIAAHYRADGLDPRRTSIWLPCPVSMSNFYSAR